MIGNDEIARISKQDFSGSFLAPLLELSDCPEKLYLRGSLPELSDYKLITVVGSRRHSPYARQALEHIIRELSGYKVCIVSGLALGIDGLAHTLALEHGLPTIAVPGSGLHNSVLYPATNRALAGRIIESGNTLLSEYKNEQKAAPWTFPKRNRLMARMADLVLVVEAAEKSGTLITARQASEYSVDVGVIPAYIFSVHSKGSNSLLRQGAHPILSAEDIVTLLSLQTVEKDNPVLPKLSANEEHLFTLLEAPLSKDALFEHSKLSSSEFFQALSLLEIKGLVKESLGVFTRIP